MGRLFNKLLFKYSCEIKKRENSNDEDFYVTILSGNKPLLRQKYWVWYIDGRFHIHYTPECQLLHNAISFEKHFDLLPDSKKLNELYKETKNSIN